jgi:sirohydrochlorin ferrochelatase
MMKTAVLLIAHGSRHEAANADTRHLAAELRLRGTYALVEVAFLELATPTMEDGAQRCVEQGAERVLLLPYFLSAGVHVRRDLTDARARFAARYPHVDFRLAEPLGRHPLLTEIVVERLGVAEEEQ